MLNSTHPPATTVCKGLLVFACLHLIVWTLLPTLLIHTAPADVLEGATWGQEWAWGYDKHPPLAPWLTALACKLSGYQAWSIYLLSQISILICGVAIWRLALKILPSVPAAIAVLLLEGIYYYSASSFEFNPNVLMLPLWALATLTFYQAIQTQSIRVWLLYGLLAGLAMMAKYQSALLLFSQLLFLGLHPRARYSFRHAGPYLALFVCLLMITPHVIWLIEHDFISIRYAVEQTSQHGELPKWLHRFFYPARFTLNQLLVLAPALLVFIPCFRGEKHSFSLSNFDRHFLYWFSIAPFALTLLLSLVTGMRLRNQYGTPLFSLIGVWLVAVVEPRVTAIQLKIFLRNTGIVFVLYVFIFTISAFTGYPRWTHAFRAKFPGPEIAKRLTVLWHTHYHRPLSFVASNRWLSSNVAFYSPDHPSAYFDFDPKISFWIDEHKLLQKGVLIIWDVADYGIKVPAALLTRFPRLVVMPVEKFASAVPLKSTEPTKIGVAFLPPK